MQNNDGWISIIICTWAGVSIITQSSCVDTKQGEQSVSSPHKCFTSTRTSSKSKTGLSQTVVKCRKISGRLAAIWRPSAAVKEKTLGSGASEQTTCWVNKSGCIERQEWQLRRGLIVRHFYIVKQKHKQETGRSFKTPLGSFASQNGWV